MEQRNAARPGKYLSFQLGEEEYAIDVTNVREIMGVQETTAVPQTPNYVKGVINLRGRVIPVIDLRLKFNLRNAEFTRRTCIVVVQMSAEVGITQVGVIVDSVSEVLTLSADDIETPPDFGAGIDMPYLSGLAKVKGRLKILLEIERVLASNDFSGLSAIAA